MAKRVACVALALLVVVLLWRADVVGLLLSALAWEFGFHG